ncbi:MAG: dockerin type I repeat-containing protein [Bacteroidaceae bacterium]|nr:dockerin type I repeat-containing protein [Bacteroidaceae bacterium]
MKKFLFTLTLTLALFTTAQAKDYEIHVGDVHVSDSNKNNINPTGKSSGTIWYDSEENTLYFKGVTMEIENCCIEIFQQDVTIYFEGTNELTSIYSSTLYTEFPITLDGPNVGTNAKVNLTAKGGARAINFNCAGDLNIWGIYLTAKSEQAVAIQGSTAGKYCELWTSCAEIEATSADGKPAVAGFNNWYMQDYAKLTGGDKYNLANKRTEDTNGNVVSKITLHNGLYVAGQMVRADATSTWAVTPSGLTSGTIKYSNEKLTLDGVNYNGSEIFVNNFNVPDLTIECTGTNVVNTGNAGLYFSKNTTLAGSGTLSLTASSSGIVTGANVTVNMAVLMVQSKTQSGFNGGLSGTLTLKKYNENSSYLFAGEKANIKAKNLVMDGMDIYSSGHYYNKNEKAVCVNGYVASSSDLAHATSFAATSKLTYYNLYVGGTQVSSGNSSYIYSPYFKKGYAMYVRSTNTLTLSDVEFEATGEDAPVGVKVGGDMGDFTISLSGDYQTWKTTNDVFDIRTNTTIGGLCPNVQLTSTKESGISTRGGVNIKVKTTGYFGAKGAKYGYWGSSGDTLTLSKTADDTYSYAFEGNTATISVFDDLILDNMDFAYQEGDNLPGCYIRSDMGSIRQNGGQVASGKVSFASIKEQLPITICGKRLNRVYHDNNPIAVGRPDISSSPTSVMYYPDIKTLVLNDATIDYDDSGTILFDYDAKATVEVKCNNSIKSTGYSGIYVSNRANVTFNGDGILDVEAKYMGINANGLNSVTTITGDLLVKANGSQYGVGGQGLHQQKLIIDGNAVIESNAIGGLSELILQGTQQLVQPSGAVIKTVTYDDDGHGWGVYASEDSKELATDVVIRSVKLGDVNLDGLVNTADVVAVYAFINYGAESGIDRKFANVNGDDAVNTADVVAIYSIIINGTSE